MSKHPLLYINFTLLAIILIMIVSVNASHWNLPPFAQKVAHAVNQLISGEGTPTSMAQFTGSYTLGNSAIY